jgi:hypothetical protein
LFLFEARATCHTTDREVLEMAPMQVMRTLAGAPRPGPKHVTPASGSSGLAWEWYLVIALGVLALLFLLWRFVLAPRLARAPVQTAAPTVGAASGAPAPDLVDVRDVTETTTLADPLQNQPWVTLAEACVRLFDDLTRQLPSLDPGGRTIAVHVCSRLRESLERSGVEVIDGDAGFDLRRHEPETPVVVPAGTAIEQTLAPGFAIGRRVLRRATVRVRSTAI